MRALCFALVLSACGGVSGADCDQVIAKVRQCDPSAATASDAMLRGQCAGTQPRCVAMPVSTPAECGAFMGCLYGD